MTNLSVFAGEYDGSSIRVTESGQLSVYDVLIAFGAAKNPRQVWIGVVKAYPEILEKTGTHKFAGRGQHNTPVATEAVILEILAILGKHPSQKAITSDRFYPRTEHQVISVLKTAFADCEPCTQLFCDGYRIDLYLARPRIAIECDENGHSNYSAQDEQERERKIKSSLGCSFVRFDPYVADFNLGHVIAEIRGLL